jgi:hypothetical protein
LLIAFLLLPFLVAGEVRAQSGTSPLDIASAPAVLVMIGDPGCPYCARFEREIAPGYTASEDGKLAPLVRRHRHDADIAFLPRIVYSPTFVMLVHGKEIGRIVGYSGADLFWMQVAGLMVDVRTALGRGGPADPALPVDYALRRP